MKRLLIVAALTMTGGFVHAQTSELPSTGTRAVPTYESVGLYWSGPGANVLAGCEVKYRRSGDAAWKQGLGLWFDARNNECRGSLVHLSSNTDYQVELNLPGMSAARALSFKTWPDRRPVARTVTVASGAATLNVTEGGSPSGYVVYQGVPGATLDALDASPYNVSIDASYVIVRGLTLKNAQQDAIRISPNVTDVIIEDNEITGWGRSRGGALGMEHDSAIHAVCGSPTLERVTVQRNEIHDPRYTANSWSDGHPQGPQAVTFSYCGGNHVIRHNEIFSTTGRYFNDIIGGADNHSTTGFPNADTDIYGNELSHAWDDAIEAEGGNRNVRIWGNYIDQTGTGIASTVTAVGPLYLFRNVYNRSRMLGKSPLDQDDRQVMFKAGSDPTLGDGRRYVFHNTMLQATQAGVAYGLGASGGISGTGAGKLLNNTVSKNNIFHNWRAWTAYYDVGVGNEFANDMYNGGAGAAVVGGITAAPIYAPGHGWQSEANGRYQLAASNPGFDGGARIPNFNDVYSGAAPDVGAHEAATAAMRFGVAASPGPAASPTPGTPTPTVGLTLSATAIAFGGQSMGTRSPPQSLTLSNTGTTAVTVSNVAISGAGFAQANDCGTLAAGASCRIDVTFAPAAGAGAIGARSPMSGTLTIASNSPGISRVATLEGIAEKSLVAHYYRSILGREADAGGSAFWEGEASRVAALGANVNETWYMLAASFFNSPEYAAFNRDDGSFLTDLYSTFFNRLPDSAGLRYWTSLLVSGLPRDAALVSFMFSPEFANFAHAIFGNTAVRAEVDTVGDFYRGLLSRLPDSAGFNYWVQRFRTAQCQGGAAVNAQVEAISSAFINGPEYANRRRTHTQYVGDLYNAFLRRGADLAGVQYWVGQLDSSARTRENVRQAFVQSPEFQGRVAAMAALGCSS